jgi:hypothetical protein
MTRPLSAGHRQSVSTDCQHRPEGARFPYGHTRKVGRLATQEKCIWLCGMDEAPTLCIPGCQGGYDAG